MISPPAGKELSIKGTQVNKAQVRRHLLTGGVLPRTDELSRPSQKRKGRRIKFQLFAISYKSVYAVFLQKEVKQELGNSLISDRAVNMENGE